jgi:cobalamin biosynthesis protein CobD/CbiB
MGFTVAPFVAMLIVFFMVLLIALLVTFFIVFAHFLEQFVHKITIQGKTPKEAFRAVFNLDKKGI